jgi:hypothetical protein
MVSFIRAFCVEVPGNVEGFILINTNEENARK